MTSAAQNTVGPITQIQCHYKLSKSLRLIIEKQKNKTYSTKWCTFGIERIT